MKNKFIEHTEQLINPLDISTLNILSHIIKVMPIKLQNKMIDKGAKTNKYMSFIINPYSTFVCLEIKDVHLANSYLPDNYIAYKTKLTHDDKDAKYYAIIGMFSVNTSAFAGNRLEYNIIAKNKDTGLVSWVIIDYDTNVMSHDIKHGVRPYTTKECILTTDYNGNIITKFNNQKLDRCVKLNISTTNATKHTLHEEIWHEGNLSVIYGKELSKDNTKAFSLLFDIDELKYGYQIDVEEINDYTNTWFNDLTYDTPTSIIYFPNHQHYVSDAPGHFSNLKSINQMNEIYDNLDLADITEYSAKSFRKTYIVSYLINIFVLISLFILLIINI